MPSGQRDSQVRADEPGPARDQQPVQEGRSYHLDVWVGRVGAGRSREEIAARRLAAGQILRQVLATYLEVSPEAVELAQGEHGKPRLRGGGDLEFNLSHSGELVAVAVTRGREVGVDVERIDPGRNRPTGFYEEWVRREATAKCFGVGLLAAPPTDPVAVELLDLEPGYAAAVAVRGGEVGQVRRRAYPSG